jgi:predicted transcriptional regulator
MVANTSDAVFAALGDATRRQILDGLRGSARRATDIAADFTVSRQAIAKHLAVLHASGLVGVERRGRERLYRLEHVPLQHVEHWLAAYRTFWASKLVALQQHVDSKRAQRTR